MILDTYCALFTGVLTALEVNVPWRSSGSHEFYFVEYGCGSGEDILRCWITDLDVIGDLFCTSC